MTTDSEQTFLGRQPILGREQQLLAYELLFRDGVIATKNEANILDPVEATATVIANTFLNLTPEEVLGPYRGFINVDEEMLFSQLIDALPHQLIVLELLETIRPTPEVIERCKTLKKEGFALAVDDVVKVSPEYHPLLQCADIIKVEITDQTTESLTLLTQELKTFHKTLLAEKVETKEQYELCQSLGYELFQGYFFARPSIITGKKLSPQHQTLLRLLAQVINDAETQDIENTFKQEPGLTINLLRLTNSVSNGLQTHITSLRHAITVMGRKQLLRWIQLLIYTNHDPNKPHSPLLQLAATRGRLMELLAGKTTPQNREFAEQAFMTGILSLMPVVLNLSLDDVLSHLPVAQRVHLALSQEEGALGYLLKLAKSTEHNETETIQELLRHLTGITTDNLNNCVLAAMSWANHLNTPT